MQLRQAACQPPRHYAEPKYFAALKKGAIDVTAVQNPTNGYLGVKVLKAMLGGDQPP
jgi:hypothetical protein